MHLTLQLVPLLIGAGKLLSGSVNPVYNIKLVFQYKESSTQLRSVVAKIKKIAHDLNSSTAPDFTNAAVKKSKIP